MLKKANGRCYSLPTGLFGKIAMLPYSSNVKYPRVHLDMEVIYYIICTSLTYLLALAETCGAQLVAEGSGLLTAIGPDEKLSVWLCFLMEMDLEAKKKKRSEFKHLWPSHLSHLSPSTYQTEVTG